MCCWRARSRSLDRSKCHEVQVRGPGLVTNSPLAASGWRSDRYGPYAAPRARQSAADRDQTADFPQSQDPQLRCVAASMRTVLAAAVLMLTAASAQAAWSP